MSAPAQPAPPDPPHSARHTAANAPPTDPVLALFEAACAASPEDRTKLMAEAAAQTPEIAREVESLLQFHQSEDAFLDHSPVAGIRKPGQPERIGGYTILGELGRGGMGVVYEAMQASPRRRVALKVIADPTRARDNPEARDRLARRLQREAEALALLDHPGIARVFEAGTATTESGETRTFVAMELVRGLTLRELARERRLSTREKLEIAASIADAVDHAHRRGVIHRDLKPENIIMQGTEPGVPSRPGEQLPRPRVLDFGIARVLGPPGGTIAATLAGEVVGTLEFMSPEQAAGDPNHVDTRSDVYAMGAILHELLVGTPPITLAGMGITSAIAAICQQEPARLGTIDPTLRGDIEAIVGKALDKEPSHRYASAAEFAADIRRHLADQPVLAHPQTAWYQVLKFARRRRRLIATSGLAAMLFVCAAIFAGWQAWRATSARDRAEREGQRAAHATDFLRQTLLAATPEGGSRGSAITVRELLDASAGALAKGTQPPEATAESHLLLAEVYLAIGELAAAAEQARLSADAAASLGPAGAEVEAKAIAIRGRAAANQRQGDQAVTFLLPALEKAQRGLGELHPAVIDLHRSLAAGYTLTMAPRLAEAEAAAREGVRRATQGLGPHAELTEALRLTLSLVLSMHPDEAKKREAVEIAASLHSDRSARLGPSHPRTLMAALDAARAALSVGALDDTASRLNAALPTARQTFGPEHTITLAMHQVLAEACMGLARFPEAITLQDHLLQARIKRFGPLHLESVLARDDLIEFTLLAGRCDAAAALIDDQDRAKATVGEYHLEPRLTMVRFRLAKCRKDLPEMIRFAERLRGTRFERETGEAVETMRAASNPGSP